MRTTLALLFLAASPSAFAGWGFFNQFVVVDRGSGDEYYDTGTSDNNTDFQGLNLGTYCTADRGLRLSGGEANTFENNRDSVRNARMYWTAFEGARPASPTFSELNLNFIVQFGSNQYGSVDKSWRTVGQDIALTEGATPGNHTLEVYFQGRVDYPDGAGGTDFFDSNNGFNYTAFYTVLADSDGDGTCDPTDQCPADPNKTEPGACGCGEADVDLDGDNIADCIDPCFDTDNDGFGDPGFAMNTCPEDNCPNAFNPGQEDTDDNQVGDVCDVERCDGADNDGNGIVHEGFTDSDADGFADCVDECPQDFDNDRDSDGVCESDDACPDDGNKTEPGECGCGVPDTDTDGDGVADCDDICPLDDPDDRDGDAFCDSDEACPEDPDKQDPGECGCGVPDTDTDQDGVPDCLDECPLDDPDDSDNDGICDSDDDCPGGPCEDDEDGDGVLDEDDECPGSEAGALTDDNGCDGAQIVDLECPVDNEWRNHGEYMRCVAQTVNALVEAGLLSEEEGEVIVSGQAQSNVGKPLPSQNRGSRQAP